MTDLADVRPKHAELVSICRTVRDRFGEKAVEDLARRHRENIVAAYAEKAARLGRNDLEAFVSQMGENPQTHTRQVIRREKNVYEMKITRCAHAEILKELNALDLGLRFVCAGDDAMLQGFNPRIRLQRPQLLMKGDDCCHFIYTMEECPGHSMAEWCSRHGSGDAVGF